MGDPRGALCPLPGESRSTSACAFSLMCSSMWPAVTDHGAALIREQKL
jgi:hypothetical protein